ncbi:AI-2E family transporter [Macrococcoides caseolyticum]|uniref:AI-2E family transporter n=1 Tax=Macrococcoides caseolyticum TaxID=69966 RepID=UPI001F4605B2|nr:AI-2E family transporter [Macrococcus caseolyticus]MCE4957140.1 AI-2E family transporter [Macrococcus caseolyticus]
MENRFIRFLGGKNLIFSLVVLILIGLLIFVLNKVSFIFSPLIIIFRTVIGPIILAFVLFYLLNPIVDFLEKNRVKRLYGIIILFLTIIGLFTVLFTVLIPIIQEQIVSFASNFPDYMKHLLYKFNELSSNARVAPYMEDLQKWVNTNLSDLPNKVGDYLGNFTDRIKSIIDTVASVAVVILTFPFVLFFLLKDGKQFKRYFIQLFPPRYRASIREIIEKMNIQVGSYIQGQMIVASCIGVLLFIGYKIIGLEYALVLACIAAVTSVVPYLGPMIAISPAIVIALVDSPVMLLKLAVVWMAVQFLEGHFISPSIMGKTMQIHPLTIIFVLLCAGNMIGIVGVILGIPMYAMIKVIVQFIFTKFKKRYNHFYQEEHGPYEIKKNEI